MSTEQPPPTIVLKQPSCELVDDLEEKHHQRYLPKVNVNRSRSAPQANNQFTVFRMGMKNKGSPDSVKKRTDFQNSIPTLSDRVVTLQQAEIVQASSQGKSLNEPRDPTSSHTNQLSSTANGFNSVENIQDYEACQSESFQLPEQSLIQNTKGMSEQSSNTMLRSELRERRLKRNGANNDITGLDLNHEALNTSVSNGSEKVSGSSSTDDTNAENNNIQEEGNCVLTRKQHHQRYPLRQAQSEILPHELPRRQSLVDMKEKGYARMEEELIKAQRALELKDEEVDELKGIRERLMKEVSDFTASLFEEVNSQLNEAALSEQQARRQLKEANTKIEMMTAEVIALKNLVLTSTPSSPNKHLHPQIDTQAQKKENKGKPFWKTHRRSTSHHQFTKDSREKAEATEHHSQLKEMDNNAFDEFARWRLQPNLDFSCQFLSRVKEEDITPCLNFKNLKLAERIIESVNSNTLSIEPIPGDHSFPRKCVLSETHKLCNYKIKFEGDDEWHSISQMSRNRIAAVCDFYAYIRYIIQGLVKSPDKDMFVEVVRLRSRMAQARLGLI